MPYSTKNYYKTLEVDSEASVEVIEVAFRRLARRYHPDVNGSQDAKERMQALNEAYGVLHDAQQRRAYDLHLSAQYHAEGSATSAANAQGRGGHRPYGPAWGAPAGASWGPTQPNPYSDPHAVMAAVCQRCGRSDASLRFAQFPYVISLIFVSLRRGEGGLYCAHCRHTEMAVARLTTLLLGWWGFPWGPIYSLRAIFTPNDGIMDAKFNAGYLRWLSGYFLQLGDLHEAKSATLASLKLRYDADFAADSYILFGPEIYSGRGDEQGHRRYVMWFVIAMVLVLMAIVLAGIYGSYLGRSLMIPVLHL